MILLYNILCIEITIFGQPQIHSQAILQDAQNNTIFYVMAEICDRMEDDGRMICFTEACYHSRRQIFDYQHQRQNHENHNYFPLHFICFRRMFHQSQLFKESDIEGIHDQFAQIWQKSFNTIMTEIAQMLETILASQKQKCLNSCIDFAKVFKYGNEKQFSEKLKKQCNGKENRDYYNIARLHFEEKLSNIKGEVFEKLKNKFVSLKAKILSSLSKVIGMLDQEFMNDKSEEVQMFPPNHKPSYVYSTLSRYQEERVPCKSYSLYAYPPYPPYPYAGTEKHISPLPNKKDSGHINKKKDQNIEYKTTHERQRYDDGEDVYLISSSIDLNPSSKNQNESQPKQKKIKKRRGRPFGTHPKPKIRDLPKYPNMFKQSQMDSFFPKGVTEDYLVSISETAKSPFFLSKPIKSICIRNQADFKIVKENEKMISKQVQLTLSQKDVYKPEKGLSPNFVFQMFMEPNQIQYLHLKDLILDEIHLPNLSSLLSRNSQSLMIIMIEQCWCTNFDFSQEISRMKNLTKLKLHSGYLRNYQLCIEHIFEVQSLEYLSLSSAVFVDMANNQMDESYQALSKISNLRNLQYLTLYNCYPVYSQLLSYLNQELNDKLEHLNLGITDIDGEAVDYLANLRNLKELNVDETKLRGSDLIRLFENSRCNLRELSIWRLNDAQWTLGKRGFRTGKVTQQEMYTLARLLPNLEYLNIAQCKSLYGFNLFRFPNLKHVCVSLDIYNNRDIAKYSKKINVYVEIMAPEETKEKTNERASNLEDVYLFNRALMKEEKEEEEEDEYLPNGY